MEPDRVVLVDSDVWPYFNRASFDQDKIVSYGDYQYSMYWACDEVLVLVRRDLRTHAIQKLRFQDYHLTINPRDSHRNTVVGISPADGRLHMSWDHHNNDLRYAKSKAGFLTEPPDEMLLDDFEPAQMLTSEAPQRVTYPRFFNDQEHNLFFMYRTGSSGNGDTVMARYDAGQGTWSLIAINLFSREGTYPPWDNSDSRNAYLHDVLFDHKGRLHVSWVYRETGGTWASNHDLHYAYSDDGGVTWNNNTGEGIADLSKNESIVLDSSGIVVREIPVHSWLMNQCAMNLDSQNCPHVATYHLVEPFIPEQQKHNPPALVYENLSHYHYWRDTDGVWRSSGPIPELNRKELGIRRPNIVMDKDDNVCLYWASHQGFRCHVAFAEDDYQQWATLSLTDSTFNFTDACKHDRWLLEKEGILSFCGETEEADEKKGYAILDFELNNLMQQARGL